MTKLRDDRSDLFDDTLASSRCLTEEESHREHHAALEATVFGGSHRDEELVLELDGGVLRLRVRQA